MGRFFFILGASMDNIIISGNVQMLQIIIFWKLSKMALFKTCEQRWSRTFYFEATLFVKLLLVMGRLYKFLLNL